MFYYIPTEQVCKACKGKGYLSFPTKPWWILWRGPQDIDCTECEGTGKVPVVLKRPPAPMGSSGCDATLHNYNEARKAYNKSIQTPPETYKGGPAKEAGPIFQ